MAFDQGTRGELQKFVTDIRKLLTDDFTRQLQQTYGMDPVSGEVAPLDSLKHLDDERLETAQILREVMDHYLATEAKNDTRTQISVLERIAREQAFTILNRLAALRMMEARGILLDSIGHGTQSQAFRLFQQVANSSLGNTGETYKHFLHSLFDFFTADLPSLFDRYGPQSRLFPTEATLAKALELINSSGVNPLWSKDETIGWIYQYFNSKEERKAMRDASQAPRNSRELAVRNQFFTPRYVVEFLVDNTLGRLWFNWTGGQTGLRDRCQYLLVKPDEQPEAAKRLRDPRTIKLLDPACGSMHFGLYAFDLFLEIYREAWAWEQTHGRGCLDTETGGSADLKPLCETYADQDAFMNDVPRLIIEHNIYGVDIDPRAAQIALLALWLRAQRAWHEAGVKAKDRPSVGRGQVVAAVAPPAEEDLRKRFMEELAPLDAELFEKTLFLLKGLPELGVLLQVEKELPALVRAVFGEHGDLFRKDDMATWQKAETRLQEALAEFARATRSTYQGRLFAEDALDCLRLIDLANEQFDAVVMNPPFGEFSETQRNYAKKRFSSGSHEILTAFLEVGLEKLKPNGLIGAITSRTSFFAPTTKGWREKVILKKQLRAWVDLGEGVLDDAMVETCSYVIENCSEQDAATFISVDKRSLINCVNNYRTNEKMAGLYSLMPSVFTKTKGSPFSYWLEPELLKASDQFSSLEKSGVRVSVGLQTGDDFRFIRCWWELSNQIDGWIIHAKGGENEPFATDIHLVANWSAAGKEMKSQRSVRLNAYSKVEPSNGLPAGLTFPYRTHRFSPALMPADTITGVAGMGVYSNDTALPTLVTILNSSVFNELVDVRLGLREINALYQAGVVSPVPFPKMTEEQSEELARIGSSNWESASQRFLQVETSLNFVGFAFDSNGLGSTATKINATWRDQLLRVYNRFKKSDEIIGKAYGLSLETSRKIHQRNFPLFEKSFPKSLTSTALEADKLASLVFAKRFGRFSHEFKIGEMVSGRTLSSYIGGMISDLSRRTSLNNSCDCASAEQMVEDFNECLSTTFDHPAEVYNEFLMASGQRTVDAYFSNTSGFFSAHLKQYSKSRRKAPIYWPISTNSGSFTLWIYYPSLTDQTLFTAVNDFIEPKLKQVGEDVDAMRTKGNDRSATDEKSFEKLQSLELELIELRNTLLEIAQTYRPNHDDGVQITAAPLWQLFRHKPWQKILKDTWAKLEEGDYDWAYLAMAYWPDRVSEKCKTDKSLAIAHDLENLYEEPEIAPGAKRGRKTTVGDT